ncbi:hypothetical protein [Kineosporia sp. A_224]|uniref:hypothetical protein n=1 Tax=Kineosporia sp. A_224 TaxID=1962180 RepID=UPI000B4B3D04|nr:hypothetical protein [Kineosporia sp. A_224]
MRTKSVLARVFLVDDRMVTTLQVPGVEVGSLVDRVTEDLEREDSAVAAPYPGAGDEGSPVAAFRFRSSAVTIADIEVRTRPIDRPGAELAVRSHVRPVVAYVQICLLAIAAAIAGVALVEAITQRALAPLLGARYLALGLLIAGAVRESGDRRLRAMAARLARP